MSTKPQPAQSDELTPLCDLARIGVGEFLDCTPVPRTWILDNLLPLGIVGLLAAGGGTGKSFLLLQLAICIVTGRPFLGLSVNDPGAVLLLCAEDEREELHRRLWRIVGHMRDGEAFTTSDEEYMRERLFIASRVGEDNLLTTIIDGQAIRTDKVERIVLTAEQIPALKLVALDPVSRFRGGDENNNDHATRFVEAVESLRSRTGATVMMLHHMSKVGLREGSERLVAENLRGASALLDGVRWAAAMATLRREDAKNYGIDPDDANRYVRLDTVKNNYGPPWDGRWLRRENGGLLVPVKMSNRREQKLQEMGEKRYRETLPKLTGFIEQEQEKGKPLTHRRLRRYSGTTGIFGIGDHALRLIVQRAIVEGAIHEYHNGKVVELKTS